MLFSGQDGIADYLTDASENKVMLHVSGHSGAFVGHHSWTQTDKEVLFDSAVPSQMSIVKVNIPSSDETHPA